MSSISGTAILVVAGVLAGVLVGAGMALLVLPFRRLWQSNSTARVIGTVLIALLAFAIVYAGFSRLFVEAAYRVISEDINAYDEAVEPGSELEAIIATWRTKRPAITRELWARQLMPPAQAGRCYTDPDICTFLNDKVAVGLTTPWDLFGTYLGTAVVAGVAAALLAHRWGREGFWHSQARPKGRRASPRRRARR